YSYHGDAIWTDVKHLGQKDIAMIGSGAKYFLSDGNDGFGEMSAGLGDVSLGHILSGDMNNDGFDDLVAVGFASSTQGSAKVYSLNYMIAVWTEIVTGLDPVYLSAVTLGDFDNDGWMDAAT